MRLAAFPPTLALCNSQREKELADTLYAPYVRAARRRVFMQLFEYRSAEQ